MTKFENYLIDIGYEKFRHDIKTMKFEPTDSDSVSSLSDLYYVYIKGDDKIYFGLNEYQKPPTLIFPRPKILANGIIKSDEDKNSASDDMMNAILNKYSSEKIYNAIYDRSIILEL